MTYLMLYIIQLNMVGGSNIKGIHVGRIHPGSPVTYHGKGPLILKTRENSGSNMATKMTV